MAEMTFNKDGKPRKIGSGKTKGAGCFSKIKWNELQEYVGDNVPIPVSRVWLRNLGVPVEEPPNKQVEVMEEPVEETLTTAASKPEPESPLDSAAETDVEDGQDDEATPIVKVTPPYRYAKDFDL